MKKKVFLLLITFFIILPFSVFATSSNEGSSGGEESKSKAQESGESEEVKAEIITRPEDLHPNGINMAVGTASYWLEVEAEISGDADATVSYQWYESKDGTMENIVPIEGETNAIFVPEQNLGTTYYCVGVITNYQGKSTVEYTKLLEATFTKKVIDLIWITDVTAPAVGEQMQEKASPFTEYDLNSHYGYDIENVSWTPDDKFFEEGKEYTINIDIRFWDDVELASELDVRVNNNEATLEKTGVDTATISYNFGKTTVEKNDNNQKSGEEVNQQYQNSIQKETVDIPTTILTTVCVIVIIFAIIVIIKRNKS